MTSLQKSILTAIALAYFALMIGAGAIGIADSQRDMTETTE